MFNFLFDASILLVGLQFFRDLWLLWRIEIIIIVLFDWTFIVRLITILFDQRLGFDRSLGCLNCCLCYSLWLLICDLLLLDWSLLFLNMMNVELLLSWGMLNLSWNMVNINVLLWGSIVNIKMLLWGRMVNINMLLRGSIMHINMRLLLIHYMLRLLHYILRLLLLWLLNVDWLLNNFFHIYWLFNFHNFVNNFFLDHNFFYNFFHDNFFWDFFSLVDNLDFRCDPLRELDRKSMHLKSFSLDVYDLFVVWNHPLHDDISEHGQGKEPLVGSIEDSEHHYSYSILHLNTDILHHSNEFIEFDFVRAVLIEVLEPLTYSLVHAQSFLLDGLYYRLE